MARELATDLAIKKIKPPFTGQVDYRVRGCPGLRLRLSAHGSRVWTYFYRFDGKLRRATVGTYPAMTLEGAHIAWGQARDQLRAGADPFPPRPKVAPDSGKIDTLEKAVRSFIKRHVNAKLRPKSAEEYRRPLEKLVVPRWGSRRPPDIGRADVIALLDDVLDSSGPTAANKTFDVVRKFFNWCIEREIVETSPCAAIKKPAKKTSRDRVLDDDELRALWPAFGALGSPFGDYFRVLALTAQRRAEVATMRWSDLINLDGDAPTWILPREMTKADREHVVPLAPVVVGILKGVRDDTYAEADRWKRKPGPFVFSTTGGEQPVSGFSRAKERVDQLVLAAARKAATEAGDDPDEAEGIAEWRGHDLRRTAASGMARLGFPPYVVAAVLNHSPGSVQGITAVYNRFRYETEKRAALAAWAAHIRAVVEDQDAKGTRHDRRAGRRRGRGRASHIQDAAASPTYGGPAQAEMAV
ncbi:MAG: tyrosine-type recombinase/integrase [Proteobacteria bacterium]|nr:tyrosine-type recombinase/integrase [Pseudomonadota bacterium]